LLQLNCQELIYLFLLQLLVLHKLYFLSSQELIVPQINLPDFSGFLVLQLLYLLLVTNLLHLPIHDLIRVILPLIEQLLLLQSLLLLQLSHLLVHPLPLRLVPPFCLHQLPQLVVKVILIQFLSLLH
jgi:hypothetical protein